MKKYLFALILVLPLSACGAKVAVTPSASPTPDALAACYHGHVGDSDSVFTVESQAGGVVKGEMAFVFAQKDSSYGTFDGTYADGVLGAKYLFWSEGVQSVGDLVFTKSGKNFKGQGYTYKPATDCANYLKK